MHDLKADVRLISGQLRQSHAAGMPLSCLGLAAMMMMLPAEARLMHRPSCHRPVNALAQLHEAYHAAALQPITFRSPEKLKRSNLHTGAF